MKLTALILTLGLTSPLLASFDFDFQCIDRSSGSVVIDMVVSANGIGPFAFSSNFSGVSMRVSSQYADYGSIQVSFDEEYSGVTKYTLHLDMATSSRWEGELVDDRGDTSAVICYDRLQ